MEVTLVDDVIPFSFEEHNTSGKRGGYIGKKRGKVLLPEVPERGYYLCFDVQEHDRFYLSREKLRVTASCELSSIHSEYKFRNDFPLTAIVDGKIIALPPFGDSSIASHPAFTEVAKGVYVEDDTFGAIWGGGTNYSRRVISTWASSVLYR